MYHPLKMYSCHPGGSVTESMTPRVNLFPYHDVTIHHDDTVLDIGIGTTNLRFSQNMKNASV